MNLNPDQQAQVAELRAKAEAAGRSDIVAKLDEATKPEPLAVERLQGMPTPEKEDPNLPTYELAEKLIAKLEERGDPRAEQLKEMYQEYRYDNEDWTEEFRGFAGIPAEMMTLGILGDEVRAGGRALVQKMADVAFGTNTAGTFSEEYKLALADEQRVEAETYEDHPVAAHSLGIAFGIVPSAKVSAAAGLGKTALEGAARQGGREDKDQQGERGVSHWCSTLVRLQHLHTGAAP